MADNTNRETSVSVIINAPRNTVFNAFLSAESVATWLAPNNMIGTVHTFAPRKGGKIHMSLTYNDVTESPDGKGGKSSSDSDTFQGTFLEIVPEQKIVWLTEFDSPDPAFAGKMTLTWSFADVDDGTEVTVHCENIPIGVRLEDNEVGSRSSLEKLAQFLE